MMQRRPALHVLPGPQICPLPPVSVQVCALVSQPSPFLQSVSCAHCTQLGATHTGVAGGQLALDVQPVCATQVLLLVHTMFAPQSVLTTHWTQSAYGLTRQMGVAAGQSLVCVAVVQTGAQTSPAHFCPCAHCVSTVHCTHDPVLVSQCGVCGRDEHAASEVHLLETQVSCDVHTWPVGQVVLSTQATQVFVALLQAGVGGAQLAQPLAARQV